MQQPSRIAYDIRAAATAVGVSRSRLFKAIAAGDLTAKRSAAKGKLLIPGDELRRWFSALPDARSDSGGRS